MERCRVTRGGVRSVSGSSSSSSIIMRRDKDTDHAATATATANSSADQQPRYYYNNDNTIKQQQQQQLHVDAHRYSSTTSISVTADQEISIFDAHKYFNQLSINNHIDDQNHKVQVSDGVSRFSWAAGSPSVSSVDGTTSINSRNINYPLRLRARSFHVVAASATPTASSEASWNSQTGHLSNPRHATTATNSNVTFMASLHGRTSTNHPPPPPHHDDHQIIKNKKLRGWSKTMPLSHRWLTSFPRRSSRCPCSGKKSVQVVAQEMKSSISPLSVVGDIYNIKMPTQIILTEDKIPPAAPTTSVVTAANLNYSSVARLRDDNRHVLWGEERRRNWDRQVNNTTINVQPAANSSASATSCISTAAGEGFRFPILKFNGDVGTSLPSATTSIQKPSNSTTNHVQCGRLIGDVNNKDEDVGSDASSDLFEIESFSTSTTQTLQAASADVPTYPPPSSSMLFQNYYRTRRDSFSLVEAAGGCTATRRLSGNNNSRRTSLDLHQHDPPMTTLLTDQYCYEPSEASIDWSVTTADGFDRSDQYDHDQHDHDHDADMGTKVTMSSKRRPYVFIGK